MVMFARREDRSFKQKMKEYFWPSMGWKRYGKYLLLKLKRISIQSTTHSAAAGLSFGYAISFNPMVGTHTFWILGFSVLTGGNFLAGMISSLVGNIWTFPFFFWISFQIGKFVASPFMEVSDGGFAENFFITLVGWPIIGTAIYVISYPIHYYIVKKLKTAYYARKRKGKKII